MTDQGARTLQQFGMDFLPVILLFAISVTGLALTVSQEWFRDSQYPQNLSQLPAIHRSFSVPTIVNSSAL